MLRTGIIAVLLTMTQPAAAATVVLDLAFAREFFQDVVDFSTGQQTGIVHDGEPYGFTGAFSDLSAGDHVQASFSAEVVDGVMEVSNCVFAGLECESMIVNVTRNLAGLFLAGSGPVSLAYDFEDMTALYYVDGPGTVTDMGMFRFYGAEFDITESRVQDATIAPLPASAWVLIAALGMLGFAARRKKA